MGALEVGLALTLLCGHWKLIKVKLICILNIFEIYFDSEIIKVTFVFKAIVGLERCWVTKVNLNTINHHRLRCLRYLLHYNYYYYFYTIIYNTLRFAYTCWISVRLIFAWEEICFVWNNFQVILYYNLQLSVWNVLCTKDLKENCSLVKKWTPFICCRW